MSSRLRDPQAAAAVLSVGAVSFFGGVSLWAVTAAVDHRVAIVMVAVGAPIMAMGAILLFIGPQHPEAERGDGQHHQDIRDFAASLRKNPYPACLKDWEPRGRHLRESLREHRSEFASIEDQLIASHKEANALRMAMQARAVSTAESVGFEAGSGAARVITAEAESCARDGKPHFGDAWTFELRDDGNLWLGAFNLGHWRLSERNGDGHVPSSGVNR